MSQSNSRLGDRAGFTLVEMLVAMAITLVMMAAVVTLFANVSSSVSKRRASLEMNGQIRQVRNQLQEDLAHATCPGITWQRPEWNHGYIELIEGLYKEGTASNLVDGVLDPTTHNPEIDHAASILPSSNMPFAQSSWATDGGGLGDYDDILMLTVRNEQKPFVGRTPELSAEHKMPSCVRPDAVKANSFDLWTVPDNIESQLAEVIWFAIENPGYTDPALADDPSANHFFGEPGMRTIYRRTLLIAPWLNPYRYVDQTGTVVDTFKYDGQTFKAVPGLLRVLPAKIAVEDAIAAIIAFQDRYDLSVRLEWDGNASRWKIMANTLGDLTKRENRFCHFGYMKGNGSSNPPKRIFPYPLESIGSGYGGSNANMELVTDPEVAGPSNKAKPTANIENSAVTSYSIDAPNDYDPSSGRKYTVRPFAYVNKDTSGVPATAQVMLNDDGYVVRVLHGPVPLWGERRGEDVMLTDALGFDLRTFDPGAPIFATRKLPYDNTKGLELDVILNPSDPGWIIAYNHANNMGGGGIGSGNSAASTVTYPYVGQGAYVDLGYGFGLVNPVFASPTFSSSAQPWFFWRRELPDVFGNKLAPGFSVYDTWSFHYENDGLNEDGDLIFDPVSNAWVPLVDEGTNGRDDKIPNGGGDPLKTGDDPKDVAVLGVDDVGERETTPPYDKPLRGVQVLIRAYERDSRTIRQVRVNQHFMPE